MGCKNRCSFCNQKAITGVVHKSDIEKSVMLASNPEAEIAFFGGSFTLIEHDYMIELLNAATEFVNNGLAKSIRFSTRPDGITREILDEIKKYPVTTIELGCQSMCDDVLLYNKRGHAAQDIKNASALIKEYGFNLGLQMMVGLYKSDNEKDIFTAKEIIALKPDCVRIYPTVVIKNTMLEKLYKEGQYNPLSLEEAIDICAVLLEMFNKENIPVIRLGLHEVTDNIAGPFHPAFGELVVNKLMLNKVLEVLKDKGNYKIFVNKSFVSKMIGQRRKNIEILNQMGYNCNVCVDNLKDYEIKIIKDV